MKLIDLNGLTDLQQMVICFKGTTLLISGLGTIFFGLIQINKDPISLWVAIVIGLGGVLSMMFGVLDLLRPRLFVETAVEVRK